mgnify:CR=1 FL=1
MEFATWCAKLAKLRSAECVTPFVISARCPVLSGFPVTIILLYQEKQTASKTAFTRLAKTLETQNRLLKQPETAPYSGFYLGIWPLLSGSVVVDAYGKVRQGGDVAPFCDPYRRPQTGPEYIQVKVSTPALPHLSGPDTSCFIFPSKYLLAFAIPAMTTVPVP